jgi:hypothetical protein
MSTAVHERPPTPRVGRLVSVASKRRSPLVPPPRTEPAAPRADEVHLLLYLGLGGAACLVLLALAGLVLVPHGSAAQAEIDVQAPDIPAAELPPPERPAEPEPSVPELLPEPGLEANIPEPAPLPSLLPESFREAPTTPAPDPVPERPAAAETPKQGACDRFGTRIAFLLNPPDAFKKAREEMKPVFFVHLSGNFEDKEFT